MFVIENESAVGYYLSSAAYLQAVVSKLLDAQAEEIHAVAENSSPTERVLGEGESIIRNIDDCAKLHLLLLMKLELLNSMETAETKSDEPETDTVGQLPERGYGEIPPPQSGGRQNEIQLVLSGGNEPVTYVFKGRGQGFSTNRNDPFFNGLAIFQTCAYCVPGKNSRSFFCYSIMRETRMLILTAFPDDIKTELKITPGKNQISVKGEGSVVIREHAKADVRETGCFFFDLQIEYQGSVQVNFTMRIQNNKKSIVHESGSIESRISKIIVEPIKNS